MRITKEIAVSFGQVKKLSEVAEFLDHKRKPIKASQRVSGDVPYYGANGIQDHVANYLFNEQLILLAEDGGHFNNPERGIAYKISGKSWVNNHAHVLRPKSSIDIDYLHWVLKHYDVRPFITGSTRAKLTKKAAENILVPIPELSKQKQISHLLEKVESTRKKMEQARNITREFLRSTFLSMFNKEAFPTLPLASVVKEQTDVTYGIVQAGPEYENGIPYIRTGDIKDGKILTQNLRHTSPDIAAKFTRSIVNAGDIVMSIRATVGTTAIVPDELEGANLTQGTARISPGSRVTTEYLHNYLKSKKCQDWISRQVKGATFREITLGRLRELEVPIPPISLQENFSKFEARTNTILEKLKKQSDNLQNLYNSILQKAFRGEL